MKKLISILLVTVMLVAMIPAAVFTTTAATAAPTGNWTDAGNYDISWCKTLTDADSSKTVTLDGFHYHVMGDWTKQTYTIDTPAKLAGLAYLSNLVNADCFKGDQFIITADLDLGAHKWVPIAMQGGSKFRGSIIGAKGNVTDASVAIKNMYVDNTSATGVESGLIGQFGGDWLKNIDLVGATVKAKDFTVGSFVGWQNGNLGSAVIGGIRQGGYVNLSSDAEIILTSGRDDRFDDVGGIVGIINATNADNLTPIISDCVFTGTISAPKGDNVGGIIGVNQSDGNGIIISDCVVISDKIEWGEDNIFLSKGEGHNVGCGGIAGNIYSNKQSHDSADAGTYAPVSFSVTNCYVAANIISLKSLNTSRTETTNVGGIIGATCNQTKTIENCQFDGIITGKAGSIGAVVGRSSAYTSISKTVVTGIALRSSGSEATFAGGAATGVELNNCFNAIPMMTGSGGTACPAITATTDFSALDFTTVWTKGENDLYPILAIAVPYLTADAPSVAKSGAEIAWFVPNGASFAITTKAQLDGLALVLDAYGVDNSSVIVSKITIDESLAEADLSKYSEHAYASICNIMGIDPTAVLDAAKVNVQFSQISLVANEKGNYDIRIVAKINDGSYKNVYFNYKLDQDGEITKTMTTPEITTCYTKLIEVVNGEEKEIVAEDGYFVVFVIPNVTFKEVESSVLAVRAYATGGDGTVYYSGQHVDITLTAPAAN